MDFVTDQAAQNPDYSELIQDIRSRLVSYFSSHISTFLEKTDEFLHERTNSASSIAEQNRMFEFMSALRVDRQSVEQSFQREFAIYLKPISQQKELPRKKNQKDEVDDDELSLVDQEDMDELVTLSTISGRAAMNMQEDISHLETRLAELAKNNKNIFYAEALRPVHICDAFQESLENTKFTRQDKIVLYKLFGVEVIQPLKDLYKELNQLLIDQGILPKIKYSSGINIDHSAQRAGNHDQPVDDPSVSPEPGSGGTISSSTYGGGRVSAGAGGVSASGSVQGPGSAGGVIPAGGESGAPASAGQPAMGSGVGNYSASHVQQAIHNFVGGVPSQPDVEGAAGAGAGGGVYYSRQEVVGALSSMQSQVQVRPGEKLEFNAEAIKRAVLSTIGEQHGGVVSKAVHQISEKTIDFIKLIFDAIIEDASITDAIKALLLSLQIPVIKAAMLDADFFVDDQHPARQLLDKLAEAGVGVSDHTDEIYIAVREIVDRLLNEYEEDIAVFDQALEALTALVEDIYRKAQERERKSSEEVQQAHARNIVLQEIRKITIGKELPKGIHTLVLKVWPSMMFNYFLKHGKANDEWVDMLMILSRIIDSVQVSGSLLELEELGLTFDGLLQIIEQKLANHYRKKELIQTVLSDLQATFEKISKQREELQAENEDVELATQLVEQARGKVPSAEDEAEDENAAEEIEAPQPEQVVEESVEDIARRKLEKLPDTIKPGTWCIVYNGEDKPVRRLKLAMILVQDATLVFVDHMGNVVIEKDAQQFAEELDQDLSGVIMQHSVFDHALHSALGSIGTTTKH